VLDDVGPHDLEAQPQRLADVDLIGESHDEPVVMIAVDPHSDARIERDAERTRVRCRTRLAGYDGRRPVDGPATPCTGSGAVCVGGHRAALLVEDARRRHRTFTPRLRRAASTFTQYSTSQRGVVISVRRTEMVWS